ncbi:MAG: hypothetical protein WBX27_15380 [Specibacter sp.]
MKSDAALPGDDRILPYSRVISAIIIPFLLAAFILLYLFPANTAQTFAWTIKPTMTPMVLASAYLGGAYFFTRVLLVEKRWHAVKIGFLAVALFATILGIATILHWDRFNHSHVTFWTWAALYFTTPFLIMGAWLANRGREAPQLPRDRMLGPVVRRVIVLTGLLAMLTGLSMLLAPAVVIPIWPWALTPLTCRVVGAVLALGSAGFWVLNDSRWTTFKLMLQVEMLMIVLILIAAARARSEFDPGRPLTWLFGAGMVAVLFGSARLYFVMERRPLRRPTAVNGLGGPPAGSGNPA